MASIVEAVRRIKSDPARVLGTRNIRRVCRDLGHCWRDRVLGPARTVAAMVMQVAHGNTALAHVVRLFHGEFTASAYCQARARLPVEVLRRLLVLLAERMREDADRGKVGRWLGHRVFLADGSGCSMPDNQRLRETFGQPAAQREGCGFPVTHVLPLIDAHTGTLMDMHIGPLKTNDMPTIRGLHHLLKPGDILVGDRAFCAYSHMADLTGAELHGVFRLHQSRSPRFPARRRRGRLKHTNGERRGGAILVRSIGPDDQIVEWRKPRNRRTWMSSAYFAALPQAQHVRLIRHKVERRGFRGRTIVIATTLLDEHRYSAEKIAELYRTRWRIETDLRHLKQTLGMDQLKCATPDGVRRELYAFALVYNMVRLVMGAAAARQDVRADRISFVDALRWLLCARTGDDLGDLNVNPARDGRCEPRVRKRRNRSYPAMTRPRRCYRRCKGESASLI